MKKNNKKFFCISIIVSLAVVFLGGSNLNYVSEKYKGIYDREFKEYVVFYPQHQDDEVLWGGSAIRKAINERGSKNIFVVLVSDGIGVNVFKNKEYRDVTKEERKKLRDNEFRAALKALGVKEENTIILGDIDKNQNNRFELMKKVALEIESKYKSVTHIAQSYKYDDHSMHRKNGEVIYDLYKNGEIKDTMFFLKPKYANDVSEEMTVLYDVTDQKDYKAITTACMEYKIVDYKRGMQGIGYTSAHNYFKGLLEDPKLTSILHLPY